MRSVSICICTYNRLNALQEALTSIAAPVRAYSGTAEILVCDNGSKTAQGIVDGFSSAQPDIVVRYIRVEETGLAHARNRAVRESKGEIVCFLDDDVLASEGWLEGIARAFELDSKVGCVAGRVKLRWMDREVPAWISNSYNGFYGEMDWGGSTQILPHGTSPVGCNFAVVKEAFSEIGLFDPLLGRKGHSLLSGEDDDLGARIWSAGCLIAYSAEGWVYHKVDKARTTFSWLLRRCFWQGVTSACRRKNRRACYPLRCIPKLVGNLLILPFIALACRRGPLYKTCFRIANSVGPFYAIYLLRGKR